MVSRAEFTKSLAQLDLLQVDRAIAFLWFYRATQQYDERSASDLSYDLQEEGFPKANVTRLDSALRKSKITVAGRRKGTFQISITSLSELDRTYSPLLKLKAVVVSDSVIPSDWVAGSRRYLEQLVHQINGAYEFGFFDCSAVLCRRLMESLIIEVYIHQSRQSEIQNAGVFLGLDNLISRIRSDSKVVLSRNSPKTMEDIKQLGDTAAHDRTYITPVNDIDDLKARYRRLIQELLVASGIRK